MALTGASKYCNTTTSTVASTTTVGCAQPTPQSFSANQATVIVAEVATGASRATSDTMRFCVLPAGQIIVDASIEVTAACAASGSVCRV